MERSVSPYEQYGTATPSSDGSLQIHIYAATDTISGLAQKFYGDWRLWRLISDRNQLQDVRRIETGRELIIPRQPLEIGLYEST